MLDQIKNGVEDSESPTLTLITVSPQHLFYDDCRYKSFVRLDNFGIICYLSM